MERSQVRAARALLGWSQDDLAKAAGVSGPTVKRIEPGEGMLRTSDEIVSKIRRAIEAAGIEFIDPESPPSYGIGVRFRYPTSISKRIRAFEKISEALDALNEAALILGTLKPNLNSGTALEQLVILRDAISETIRREEEFDEAMTASSSVSPIVSET
ncbi:transcriptional regulator with XRE-family HTH domain [Angulomicrobium tetraedrale]|uniref:Transcriptional regulator with XRE-family HTH domain n=1 Tax=Ancylobacter tetraedralis TaxID=217068 RepID=A0A839ZBA7_9HYPH|nr:transcriptional regulator with XRE-family HTH domain [Ancylobacter tetraedralis]